MNQPILFDDIYVRHPYKYKGTKSLDVKLFKNEILFKQKNQEILYLFIKQNFLL